MLLVRLEEGDVRRGAALHHGAVRHGQPRERLRHGRRGGLGLARLDRRLAHREEVDVRLLLGPQQQQRRARAAHPGGAADAMHIGVRVLRASART